jgi:hypothetical protein
MRDRPVTVLVWAIFWIVVGMGPLLATLGLLVPKFITFVQELESLKQAAVADRSVLFEKVGGFYAGMFTLMGPWMLWLAIVSVVLSAAILRAVLEPRKSGFAYLRLGADELRLILLNILIFILTLVFTAILTCVAAAAMWAAHRFVPDPWTGWAIFLVVVLAFCLAIVIPIRLSLAPAMTFAEKNIRIFESWRLTRGRFWKMLGMWLLTLFFVIVVAIGFSVIRNIVLFSVGGASGAFGQLAALEHAEDVGKVIATLQKALGPLILVLVAIQGLVDAILRVIAVSPSAAAYAALSGRDAEEA